MPDFLTKFLAGLFEAFKQKSPKTAAILLLVLVTLVGFADQGTLVGLLTLPAWLADAVEWLGLLLASLIGSQTYQYLPADKKASR